ncbi:MAG TPA: glycosyltransferase [Usitatibacter sp.]|nr:glycosyltransferase [Usitatibacter sp.]
MRLLFAIKSLNVVGGGAERVLVGVANGLARRGHDVRILTFDTAGDSFYPLDPGISRIDTGIGVPGRPTPRTGFLRNMGRLRGLVHEARPDLAVVFMHSMYVPFSIALLGSGTPLVFSEHIDAAHYRTRPLQRLLVRTLERLAVAKTVPSGSLLAEHRPAERHRVHVQPNAVDLPAFQSARAAQPAEPSIVLCAGRFMAQKNQAELIEAFSRVSSEFPAWRLRLVGEGEQRGELEAMVARFGLQARVAMPGVARDMAAEYAAAGLVALPSRYESFGLVAAEALASGRALLAFDDCLGIAELVENGRNGILVPARGERVAHLADGLRRLMGDAALRARLGAAGPQSVERFDLPRVIDSWEAFLADTLKSVRSPAMQANRDDATIDSFGDEWSAYPQSDLPPGELEGIFRRYFDVFPWDRLSPGAVGFDMGCGSGRWAAMVAPRVGHLHCIDASPAALEVARRNLASQGNVSFHRATTDNAPLEATSCDFGYSLGVLHHVPDTAAALGDCARLLKPGAPMLVYLYYRFDNRPAWFRLVWTCSNLLRTAISRLPSRAKRAATATIAVLVYWPVSRLSRALEKLGMDVAWLPLSFYRSSSLRTLLTDSRDRFGTPLEHRFTRQEIARMMENAGLANPRFSEGEPYWCCVGYKA